MSPTDKRQPPEFQGGIYVFRSHKTLSTNRKYYLLTTSNGGNPLPKWKILKRKEQPHDAAAPKAEEQAAAPLPQAEPILEYTETLIAEDHRGTPPKPEPSKTWKRTSWEPPEDIETHVDRIAVKNKAATPAQTWSQPTTIDLQVDHVLAKKKKPRA